MQQCIQEESAVKIALMKESHEWAKQAHEWAELQHNLKIENLKLQNLLLEKELK